MTWLTETAMISCHNWQLWYLLYCDCIL